MLCGLVDRERVEGCFGLINDHLFLCHYGLVEVRGRGGGGLLVGWNRCCLMCCGVLVSEDGRGGKEGRKDIKIAAE
jgi:hypothetical protein